MSRVFVSLKLTKLVEDATTMTFQRTGRAVILSAGW